MKNNFIIKIRSHKSSVRNNILAAFFMILAISGIIINILFINILRTDLSEAGLTASVITEVSRHITLVGIVVTASIILAFFLIGLFFANTITNPLKKLTQGMNDLAEGKWDTRININSDDELAQLARGFNFMADHIEQTMRELGASKEYTDNIVMSVPSILIVVSNQRKALSVNTAFHRLKDQYPRLTPDEFISALEDDIGNNFQTRETTKREIEFIPTGSEVSLIFSAVISSIGENGVKEGEERAAVLLTITNITERMKMKELVLQSRQDWEDTFNTIPDMITIHDKDYNIIMANKAAKETLNIHLMDFKKSCKCYEYYHGAEAVPKGCPSCDCLRTEEPATFEIYEPHLKKFIEIRSIPRFNNKHQMIGLIHIVRDITLRKEIEDEHNKLLIAITKAKIEWEMTFDSVTEYIVLIDRDLKITRCNKSFCTHVNKSIDNIIGHHCYEFFPCSAQQIEDCRFRMITPEKLQTKRELETENGRWLYISHRPIQDDDKEHLRTVIIATDVTELKHAQQRIRESEKELKKKVDDLEKFYDMAIGREIRMKELKREIKKLNRKMEEHEKNSVAK